MDKSRLSKVIFITAAIWVGIFLVFAATAVTLAFASTPLFSFLILVGLIASSLAANLYWTESHQGPAVDHAPEPEVVTTDSASSRVVRFQNLVLSEPCLFREQAPKPRRSYSSPRLAERRTCEAFVGPTADVLREDVQDVGSCQAEDRHVDRDEVREEDVVDVEGVQNLQGGIWPVSLSEMGFNCSPDAPASWKETTWIVSGASSPEGDTLLSDSSGSTRKVTTEDSSTPWIESGPLSESAFWNADAWTAVDSSEGFQQEGDRVWATPDDLIAHRDPTDDRRPEEDAVARGSPDEVGAVVEPSTLSLIKARSPLVVTGRMEGADECGRQPKKKSKKRFKLVPRFLKGKKKEFSRFN